ncbi:MAG: sigma-54-dependent Fis family transcriptional regulator [Deltaproteobacteria bacterium]|nr:sigma-54-dependent Fis family transcriptional regulator [Deltaproteobacteria bacterium]
MKTSNFKILIVDDDADIRVVLRDAVKNWGFSVSDAKDGEQAILMLMREHFDIVISDLMMPALDGLTLLQKIKELNKEILVIIITGYATIETAVKAINAGAYDYIAKPFSLDELMVVIRNASERLSLASHNKSLLNDLRSAHAEISALKIALDQSGGQDNVIAQKRPGVPKKA